MRIVCVNLGTQDSSHAHAEVQGVKCRTQIDVERIVHGAGKHPYVISKAVDTLAETGCCNLASSADRHSTAPHKARFRR